MQTAAAWLWLYEGSFRLSFMYVVYARLLLSESQFVCVMSCQCGMMAQWICILVHVFKRSLLRFFSSLDECETALVWWSSFSCRCARFTKCHCQDQAGDVITNLQ